MEDVVTQIADRVAGVAAEKRASQSVVAGIVGLSRQAVNMRYNAKIPWGASEVLRLARHWQVPIERFFPAADAGVPGERAA